MSQNRRSFLKHSAAVISAASLGADGATPDTPFNDQRKSLDPAILRAVADAVLPNSIGPNGKEIAVEAFELWISEFHPVAELTHPYGGSEIPYGPPDPEPGWSSQLSALAMLSDARWGSPFADLSNDRRRELLEEQIGAPTETFPPPGRAQHVATALMAHYFTSADAVDRCYQVRIAKLECRSIVDVKEQPAPLEEMLP
jgi:hypothetical protein